MNIIQYMRKFHNRRLRELLPWYVNGTLEQKEMEEVKEWVRTNREVNTEIDELGIYYRLIQQIPQKYPSNQLMNQIKDKIGKQKSVRSRVITGLSWGIGGLLTMGTILILWITIQPGLTIRWTVEGRLPEVFRVYRNTSEAGEYMLVSEIETIPEIREYEYIDSLIFLSGKYRYKVEGLYEADARNVSQSVSGSAGNILIIQIMIIITSILFGIATAIYLQSSPIGFFLRSIRTAL